MHLEEITLTSKDILEKAFKVDTRGYRPKEVDKFLDGIIKDYVEFEKVIKSLSEDKEKLVEEIKGLKDKQRNMEDNIEIASSTEKEIPNVDLLKRISKLEKLVYDIKSND